MRHMEADRPRRLLDQMADRACRARQQRHGLQPAQRKAGIEQHGGNRRRHFIISGLPMTPAIAAPSADRLDMPARDAELFRDLEQLLCARIALLVQWMAVAGDGALLARDSASASPFTASCERGRCRGTTCGGVATRRLRCARA